MRPPASFPSLVVEVGSLEGIYSRPSVAILPTIRPSSSDPYVPNPLHGLFISPVAFVHYDFLKPVFVLVPPISFFAICRCF